ncbi:hypothetical protein EVJ58_g6059 [Rhodofomes roseus]|uniref:Uncharacterized protein n=1 Tax=Rhodofomes roseus TaxID=34475 RepID=A0A4Y9YBY5_9APHY|nr:hypothetical protein EVJ58_g6059 [Rhodofomes roseus]
MEQTFKKLGHYMRHNDTHVKKPGRKSRYTVEDPWEMGIFHMFSSGMHSGDAGGGDGEPIGQPEGMQGAAVEEEVNGEDGDLDV